MIIMKITGGLGNQLFQYALGRALSLQNKDELKFDVRNYDSQEVTRWSTRRFELPHFNITGTVATHEESERLENPYGKFSKLLRSIRFRLLKKSNIRFFPHVLRKRGDLYLDGYWQSEKYFQKYSDVIRADITPKKPLSKEAQILLTQIENDVGSLSLHIRRGDNAYNLSSMRAFGMPADEYYTKALETFLMRTGKKTANVYLFTDDVAWVKDNMSWPLPITYVSRAGIADWEEIILMKACRHHIISNSTFSWWGAWLNPRKDKIVIAPKHWAKVRPQDFQDIIPEGWLRI